MWLGLQPPWWRFALCGCSCCPQCNCCSVGWTKESFTWYWTCQYTRNILGCHQASQLMAMIICTDGVVWWHRYSGHSVMMCVGAYVCVCVCGCACACVYVGTIKRKLLIGWLETCHNSSPRPCVEGYWFQKSLYHCQYTAQICIFTECITLLVFMMDPLSNINR